MTEDVLKNRSAKEELVVIIETCKWRSLRAISEDTAIATVGQEIG